MEEGKDRPASWIVQNEWRGPSYATLAAVTYDAYEYCRYELLQSVFGLDIMAQVETLASQEICPPDSNVFAERLAHMIYQKKQRLCNAEEPNTVKCIQNAAFELWRLQRQVSEEHDAACSMDPTIVHPAVIRAYESVILMLSLAAGHAYTGVMSHPNVDEMTKNEVLGLVERGMGLAGGETDTSKVVQQVKHAVKARGSRSQETRVQAPAQPRASTKGKRAREAAAAAA
jgi:hypothetical protein